MKKRGVKSRSFTLVEVVVYLSLLLILSFCVSRIFFQIRNYSELSKKVLSEKLRYELFFDILHRDLISAYPERLFWDEKNFVFRKEGPRGPIDIGFCVKKGAVCRVKGVYDFLGKKWLKKNSSLVLRSLPRKIKIRCKLEKEGGLVRRVKVLKRSFRLRNGKV